MASGRDFPIEPMSGFLDTRSADGQLSFEQFRLVLNMDISEQKKRRRMGGWKRFGYDSPYGFQNQDLHDQWYDCLSYFQHFLTESSDIYGVPVETHSCGETAFQVEGCREPVTLMFEATTAAGKRRLIYGTRSRLYSLNERDGNVTIIGDRFGGTFRQAANCVCSDVRFKATQYGNLIFFTNNIDPVLVWQLDAPIPDTGSVASCNQWAVDYVADLVALSIIRAGQIATWKGFLFVADLMKDGAHLPGAILWSDIDDPRSFIPGGESASRLAFVSHGEKIVAMGPIGGQFRIYTVAGENKAIYEAIVVGGDEIITLREIYRGPDGVEFPNSFINTGDRHYWAANSGIFELGEYDRIPVRSEWIHKATGVIYSGLPAKWVEGIEDKLAPVGAVNRSQCEQFIGGYDSIRKALWFSWPTDANVCANMSLMLNLQYGGASIVDHGFTAFVTHRPDYSMSLRQFLETNGICLNGFDPAPRQAMPYEPYTWGTTTDWVCANLSNVFLDEFCRSCEGESVFLLADATDFAVKQYDPDSYYRETLLSQVNLFDCPNVSVPVYEQTGYTSLMQGDSYGYGLQQEKLITNLVVQYEAVPQTTPNELNVQIGYAAQPSLNCMRWAETTPRALECLTDASDAEHDAGGTRAARIASYPTYRAGAFLAWRMWVEGTGGGSTFNMLATKVRPKQGEWK